MSRRIRRPRRVYPGPESAKADVEQVVLDAMEIARHQIEGAHLEDLEVVAISCWLADW